MSILPIYHPDHTDVPQGIRQTCEAWHDGFDTEMDRLSRFYGDENRPIDWAKIEREIRKCQKENEYGREEADRLQAVLDYIDPFLKLDKLADDVAKSAESVLLSIDQKWMVNSAVEHGLEVARRNAKKLSAQMEDA